MSASDRRAAELVPEISAGAVRVSGAGAYGPTPTGSPVRSLEAASAGVGVATEAAVATAPTQIRRPWRTMFRTFVQSWLPTTALLVLALPEVIEAIVDEAGDVLPERIRLVLLGVSTACSTLAAVAARVMAIPRVELLLRRILPRLAAAPPPPSSNA